MSCKLDQFDKKININLICERVNIKATHYITIDFSSIFTLTQSGKEIEANLMVLLNFLP